MPAPKKSITALPEDEALAFLEQVGLADDYTSGRLLCHNCQRPLVSAGLASVWLREGFLVFSCPMLDCMSASKS